MSANKRTPEISPQKFIEVMTGVKVDKNGCSYNPQFIERFDAKQLTLFWEEYDMRQCTSKYIWENIPFKGYTSQDIERMRYYRGQLGFLDTINALLPTFSKGELNFIGHSNKGGLTTFSGMYEPNSSKISKVLNGKTFDMVYDGYKDEYSKEELQGKIIVLPTPSLIYNGEVYASRYMLNKAIINEMIDVFKRISNNIAISSKKLIFNIKDGSSVNKVAKDIETAFNSDNPYVITDSQLDVSSIQSTNDLNAQELFRVIKEYDNIRCLSSGILCDSYGNEKKERLIQAETESSDYQVNMINEVEYQMLKDFCKAVNKVTGGNLSVRKVGEKQESIEEGEDDGSL